MEFSIKLKEKTGKAYLSYSSVKEALGDLREWEMYMLRIKKKDSPALSFGSLYDCLLFEPEKVEDRFIVMDETAILQEIGGKSPRATKQYKEWKSQFELDNESKTIVSEEDHHTALNMISRLDDCGLLQSRMKGKYQVEFYEFLEDIPVRGFLDVLGDGYIVDSKSSRSVKGFRKDVYSFCYDIQAYIYTTVFGINEFYWVVQEKTYPYFPAEFKASEETIQRGQKKFWTAVGRINEYLNADVPTTQYFLQDTI